MRLSHPIQMAALLALITSAAQACDTQIPLEGALNVPSCSPGQPNCVEGARALRRNSEAVPDVPTEFSIVLQASPWRLYDAEYRVLPVRALAATLKPLLTKGPGKRVRLLGSWTGVQTGQGQPALAVQLTKELGGIPVDGVSGFLWFSKDGKTRATRQAFSVRAGALAYAVGDGAEVMASMVAGWPASVPAASGVPLDAEQYFRIGVGHDVLLLCPEIALQNFEKAAELGHPLAAFNAAQMRLQRQRGDDLRVAKRWLQKASELGDVPSMRALGELKAAETQR